MLTPGQIAHFETFGFLVQRQLFTPDETAAIKREATENFQEDREGRPFGGEERYIQPFFERKPFLSSLPADDRIYSLGEQLMGPDFMLIATEGNLHVGPTPWHGGVENNEGTLPSIKIGIYPDRLTKETGCLRVVPGSHLVASPDLYEPLRKGNSIPDHRPFGMAPEDVPCVPLETWPGDAVVFLESMLHSSFGGKPGRQQLAIDFFANPTTDEQVRELIDSYNRANMSFRPAESYVNSDNPRIRGMVSRMVELGFETSKV